MPSTHPIRILHLSDFHFRDGQAWDADPVLNGLAASVGKVMNEGLVPDLVALTGDIAFSGKAAEYDLARTWLERKLFPQLPGFEPRDQLLMVPGNHDADRTKVTRGTKAIQSALLGGDQDAIKEILSGPDASLVLGRHDAYLKFANGYRTTPHPLPWWGELRDIEGVTLGLAGLCSAWMSCTDNEQGQLLLGRYQLNSVLGALETAGIRVALVHHPYSYLKEFDGEESKSKLQRQCLLVLRGHLHEQQAWQHVSPDETALELAAGSAYAGSQYPNCYQVVEIEPDATEVRVHMFTWHRDRWIRDRNAYDRAPEGVASFRLTREQDAGSAAASRATLNRDEQEFLDNYRARLRFKYGRWDLANVGITQPGGVGQPLSANLEDIYQPLRLAEGYNPQQLNRGEEITPAAVLARARPLIIRGQAGSGKTTWMRRTFDHLVRDERTLPIMVELRKLAAVWQKAGVHGKDRSIDTYIANWVAEHGVEPYDRVLDVLKNPAAARPVLLVDGWDELGTLGDEFRGKLLGFLAAHSHVALVVTSRPYGESRPSASEGFEVLDIQPLSDEEIQAFTERFHRKCYGEEGPALKASVDLFSRALERAPEPRELARTALLLTMMLLIGRGRPLPDKRHLLYQTCIDNLLTARPDRRAEEGALDLPQLWRPESSEERTRVVAALAFSLQDAGYKDKARGPVIRSWDDMQSFLPAEWSPRHKSGFLAWLAGPANLLVDRADGTLSFVHLSFQEFLVARWLDATAEGEARIAVFLERLATPHWWETLRLWAALVEGPNPSRLTPVLRALIESEAGFWLAGQMFADGLGDAAVFPDWVERLPGALRRPRTETQLSCAAAWGASSQAARKTVIGERVTAEAAGCHWLRWLLFQEWSERAVLPGQMARPRPGTNSRPIVEVTKGQVESPRHVAVSRLLWGSPGPRVPEVLAMLRAWPSDRLWAGHALQTLACLPLDNPSLQDAARIVLRTSPWKDLPDALPFESDKTSALAGLALGGISTVAWGGVAGLALGGLASVMGGTFGSGVPRDTLRDILSESRRSWVRPLSKSVRLSLLTDGLLGGLTISSRMKLFPAMLFLPFLFAFRSHFNLFDKLFDKTSERIGSRQMFAGIVLSDESQAFMASPEKSDLARFLDMAVTLWSRSKGRSSLLADSLADPLKLLPPESLELGLLRHACQLSINPEGDAGAFERSLANYPETGEPLWPALARQLTRRSTESDRALLTELALEPERRNGALGWGLKHIVRGDVVLDNGSEITLDALAAEVGMPAIPVLEDLPAEPTFPLPRGGSSRAASSAPTPEGARETGP